MDEAALTVDLLVQRRVIPPQHSQFLMNRGKQFLLRPCDLGGRFRLGGR